MAEEKNKVMDTELRGPVDRVQTGRGGSEGRLWRTGRKVGRTIYVMDDDGIYAPEAGDDDPLIGVMDTRELAQEAVDAHNASLSKVGRERDEALAAVYRQSSAAAAAVARACDEELDRSGALLGRVRQLSRTPTTPPKAP